MPIEISPSPNSYTLLTAKLGQRIRSAMQCKHIDQKKLAFLTNQSQSTISNILCGKTNVSMKTIFLVLEALDLDPIQELARCVQSSEEASFNFMADFYSLIHNETGSILCDPSDSAFNGILNTYHTYFQSTNRNENFLLHGVMQFYALNQHCAVEFRLTIPADSTDMTENGPFIKIYKGYAFISAQLRALYVILINQELGEMCFLTFPYTPILTKGKYLECTMGTVTTISSGIDSRVPTVHRIFISQKPLDPDANRQIKAQLKLNKSSILISEESFKKMCENERISSEFIEEFKKHSRFSDYYEINEDFIKQLYRKDTHYYHELCILREYSSAPANNKINTTAISNIYRKIIQQL